MTELTNMKMLLIDDDEGIRKSLGSFFHDYGYHIQAFETAEEALEIIELDSYDVILCDYYLPGMNGVEFFKRAMKILPESIKILITAFGDDDIASEAFGIGVHDFVQKPFSGEAIINTVSRLMK